MCGAQAYPGLYRSSFVHQIFKGISKKERKRFSIGLCIHAFPDSAGLTLAHFKAVNAPYDRLACIVHWPYEFLGFYDQLDPLCEMPF